MAQRHTSLRLAADLGAAVLELTRMVSEKVSAATAGTIAAQTETMRIAARALRGKNTPHASTAVVAAALKPALRTVKANAKRLGKKR